MWKGYKVEGSGGLRLEGSGGSCLLSLHSAVEQLQLLKCNYENSFRQFGFSFHFNAFTHHYPLVIGGLT